MCPECLYAEDALTGFEEDRGILSVPYVRARAVTGKPLPAMQAALLQYLRANPGRIIGREELAERVWKQRHFYGSRAIDQAVANLRKQLHRTNEEIISVWSVGYRFESHQKQPARPN
jgi:DNA-binding response OmpR family regulator